MGVVDREFPVCQHGEQHPFLHSTHLAYLCCLCQSTMHREQPLSCYGMGGLQDGLGHWQGSHVSGVCSATRTKPLHASPSVSSVGASKLLTGSILWVNSLSCHGRGIPRNGLRYWRGSQAGRVCSAVRTKPLRDSRSPRPVSSVCGGLLHAGSNLWVWAS